MAKIPIIHPRHDRSGPKPFGLLRLALIVFLFAFLSVSLHAQSSVSDYVTRLYRKLNGYVLPRGELRTQMEEFVRSKQLYEAALLATQTDSFYGITLVKWAMPLSNREETGRFQINDLVAMVVGNTRDDEDARKLLYDDFLYVANGADPEYRCLGHNCTFSYSNPDAHFAYIENNRVNLRRFLIRQSPQWPQISSGRDSAGIFTSATWARAHLSSGTNRRSVEYAFRGTLCTPIAAFMDVQMPEENYLRIRQDVDRAPGGDPNIFRTFCRGCHGGMDGLAGAFAYFDAPIAGFTVPQGTAVQPKMVRNSHVYPNGYVTRDNSWVNYFTHNQNAAMGWRGPLQGRGAREFGMMLANSRAFSNCNVTKIFRQICGRSPETAESAVIQRLADRFESGGYNLRHLFAAVAVEPICLGVPVDKILQAPAKRMPIADAEGAGAVD